MSIDAFQGPQFTASPLLREMLDADPFNQFEIWYKEAEAKVSGYASPMTLAACGNDGQPIARTVLLKGVSPEGFCFYTNYQSRKAQQLEQNPKASLCLFWEELERQVLILGSVVKMTAEESDAYFASRPRGSQLGAHVSQQSQEIASRATLEYELTRIEEKVADTEVSRPEHWGGYRLVPSSIEFWQGQPDRLHDRFIYEKSDQGWSIKRLAP